MSDEIFAVYGASGHGRETMPIARQDALRRGASLEKIYFIDDAPQAPMVNGHRVVRYSEFLQIPATRRLVVIAIAESKIREKLAAKCALDNIIPWSVRADNVVVLDDVTVAEGSILSPFSSLTSNIRIGRYFHANIYSSVAHDCIIGDFVTFAPGVKCNGNVVIEDHAYIGSGAVLKQGQPGRPLVIGQGAVVGMGAIVTKNVAPGEVVIGNPARPLNKA